MPLYRPVANASSLHQSQSQQVEGEMTQATKEDLHEYQRLAHEGRVYEIINWINAGRPIRFVNGRYKKPLSGLRIAVDAGGHSLLKALLELGNWTATELNDAAASATQAKRAYLVDLLFDHGATADQCNVFDFFQMMDVELAERALGQGLGLKGVIP